LQWTVPPGTPTEEVTIENISYLPPDAWFASHDSVAEGRSMCAVAAMELENLLLGSEAVRGNRGSQRTQQLVLTLLAIVVGVLVVYVANQ
jgi:hypothetical protein